MTCDEMYREFNLLYNNVMSNAAPGLDEYEVSVFLTKAQESLITSIYTNTFEGTESMRECLDKLVVSKQITTDYQTFGDDREPISSKSKFFELPNDVLYIVYESLTVKDNSCSNGREVLVKPVTHDDYFKSVNNPFKRPRTREALRLNINGNNSKVVEIVSTYNNYIYNVRYIRKPKPIILIDLSNGLTIDGESIKQDCELPVMCHRAIVEAAVTLAAAAYKGQ